MNFSYASYAELLLKLKGLNYQSLNIGERSSNGKVLYLRHDVDIDWKGVAFLSSIETKIGFKSTWYFLTDSPVYNLFFSEIENLISALVFGGHEVGFHIDATRYGSLTELEDDINRLYEFFSKRLPISKNLSFHKPADWLLQGIHIDGWINAYEAPYYSDVVYVSDSNRREFWKENRLPSALDSEKSLTLLTHPLWWHSESLGATETFDFACNSLGLLQVHNTLSSTAKLYKDKGILKVKR